MLIITVFIFVRIIFVQLIFYYKSLLFIIFVFHYSVFPPLLLLTTVSIISFPSFVIQSLSSPINFSMNFSIITIFSQCLSVNFPSCFFFPIPDCICLIFSSAIFESEYANLIFSKFLIRYSIPLMYIAHNNLIQFRSFF